MKFTINSKELLAKLQYAAKVINSKNTIPILDCFLLGIRGSTLFIAASDTETRLATKIDVSEVDGESKIAIDAHSLLDALKEIPEQPLVFEVNNENQEVFIRYHNGYYNLIGQSGEEYPEPRSLSKDALKIVIEPHVLLEGIQSTLFASADDELRPVMNGVYFDITDKDLTFVASDGHKLVRLVSETTKGSERSSFILPKKPANVLRTLLIKETEPIIIQFDLNNAVFKIEDFTLTARFIEGRYPNYNSVIPHNNSNTVILNKDSLTAIIKRVSVFGNKQTKLIRVDLSNNAIDVTSQDIDYSTSAKESAEVEYYGDEMSVGFKSTFLIELLNSIESGEVELQLSDPSKAALIVPTQNKEGYKLTTLLMPMMLND